MLSSLLLALVLAPQLELTWQHALIGSLWRLEANGDAGAVVVVIPSLQDGPTSLPLLGGVVLDIGLELAALTRFALLDGAGKATIDYSLPLQPGLSGLELRAQSFVLPVPPGVIEQVSGAVQATIGVMGTTHTLAHHVLARRSYHSATELEDGRVLLLGGESLGVGSSWPLGIELYDPQTGKFEASSEQLPNPRAHHTATLLNDGRVLIVGGIRPNGQALQSAMIYNPDEDKLVGPMQMVSPRVGHTAHLLPDGDVLVIGGSLQFTVGHPFGLPAAAAALVQTTTERFDASNASFGPAAPLPLPRFLHAATELTDGSVLLVGGVVSNGPLLTTTPDARVYLPASNAWAAVAALPKARALHGLFGTQDGGALAFGGGVASFTPLTTLNPSDSAWHFVPGAAGVWQPVADTNALVVGGEQRCYPRPNIPPPSEPNGPGTFPPILDTGPEIVYFAGSSYQSLDLATGEGVLSDQVLSIAPDFAQWNVAAAVLEAREGETFTQLSGTLRVLRIGASSVPSDPGGEETVLAWPLP